MAIVVLPAAAAITLLAPQLLQLVYGAGYEGGIVPLQILIWSAALIILNGNFRQTLIAFEEQKKLLAFTTASAVVNVSLNFLLIPRYGLTGQRLQQSFQKFYCLRSATNLLPVAGFTFYSREL